MSIIYGILLLLVFLLNIVQQKKPYHIVFINFVYQGEEDTYYIYRVFIYLLLTTADFLVSIIIIDHNILSWYFVNGLLQKIKKLTLYSYLVSR